jgi:YbbR domain-containing protein
MDKWLRNTNVVRVIALVIGILLWVVVHMEERTVTGTTPLNNREETINNVTITKKYDESLYYISSISPSNVQVIVRGKDSVVKKLTTSNNYTVELDLTKVGKGEHELALTPVGFPSTLEVEIVPRTVRVVIEEQQKKEVPVTINVKGTPAAGLKAGQPIVKPNKVYITAPTSRLSEIEAVRGEVSVDKADAAVTKQVKLIAYDKNGKEMTVSMNPQVVDVEVPITSPFQTIPLQLKITGEPLKGYAIASIVQSPDKVTVYGKQDVVDKMEFYQGPPLNLQNVSASNEYILDIPLLANKITQVDPAKVSVQVEIVPSVTKALENIPITIIGQNDGFNTKVITPDTGKINITVEGAPKIIDSIKASDVQAIVDVSNLPPGQHHVVVSFNLPSFVKKGALQDVLVTVEISSKAQAQESTGPSASPTKSP